MLEQIVIIIHIIAAVSIVALILLQQGKGADMGASFGAGASQTVLGVQGGGNLLTHATAVFVAIFFTTSLSLAYVAKQKTSVNPDNIIVEQIAPKGEAEVPSADNAKPTAPAPATSEVPAAETDAPQASIQAEAEPATEEAPAAPAPAPSEIPE